MGELPPDSNGNFEMKVLVGEAKWTGERVEELRQLAEQIQLHVAEDDSKDTPLVAEVERLGFRITCLTEAIHGLSNHLSKQPEQRKEQLKNVSEGVSEAEELLKLAEPESAFSLQRSNQLQSKLLALGSHNGPHPDADISQEPVIETWKNVLKSTHGRYEQVLAGLSADDDQLEAAINSWQQYVDSVEESVNAPIPATREGLHEAARLCQVHRSIMNTQSGVVNTLCIQAAKEDAPPKLKSLQGRLRDLVIRHRTTLGTVTNRENLLNSTIVTWETYRGKVALAQKWLLALEHEKQGLQLRQVPQSRLPKMISRLQSLLDQLTRGEVQVEEVGKLCEQLTASCDSSIHPILRAEFTSLHQRVENLRAGLETWLKHLKDNAVRWKKYEDMYHSLDSKLKQHQAGLSTENATEFSEIREQITENNKSVESLQALNTELSAFRSIREEMVDTLTPADLRIVTNRMWRLLQLQGELIHQYRMRISGLEDSLELWQLYDTRYTQFMKWISDMENKIDGGTEQYIDALIRKLEHEYQVEIGMKNIEKMWLVSEGKELLKCSNEEQGKELESKIDTVEQAWKNIIEKCKLKKQKLVDIMTTITKTELTLTELKKWLFQIEKRLSSPVLFTSKSKKEIDRLLEVEEDMKKEIEQQSCNISSVLNLCEIVIRDCNEFDANGETDSLQEAYNYLEKRWGSICTRSAERKMFIKKTRKLWEELFRIHGSFISWLSTMERRVGSVNARSTDLPYADIQATLDKVHELQKEIHNQTKEYEDLNQKYRVLARPHGRENRLDQAGEIKQMVKESNLRFHSLSYFVSMIIKRLRYSSTLYEEFKNERESLADWLNEINSRMSEIEEQSQAESITGVNQSQNALGILIEWEEQEPRLNRFDSLTNYLYQRSTYPDCQSFEDCLGDISSTRAVVQDRLRHLRDAFVSETEEAMRASTAYPAVQAEEDLAYSLVPDSEIGSLDNAFDITLVGAVGGRSLADELRVAIEESRKLLLRFEEAVRTPTPPGVEVDKMYYTFSKQFAGCRSSVDLLVALSKQVANDAEAEALMPEVIEITEEFAKLERLAQTKQQRMKENSETSSLTCPLCCKRNWNQFENDMWRLEQWLSHSEATQSILHNPPSPIEDLEEAAQDHREFLMDLDGHKSVIMSLNVIGRHLAEHTRDIRRAQAVQTRLDAANKRWEGVCRSASAWQAKLQAALMGNVEFHKTVAELLQWTEDTEASVRAMSDSESDDDSILRERVNRLLDIRAEAERCEPRVASLYHAAHHLLHTHDDASCMEMRERLAVLSRRLQLLLQLISQKLAVFSQRLGHDYTQSLASLASTGLYESTEFSLSRPTSPSLTASFHSVPSEVEEEGVVRRSYRFLGRVVRAALPIQALMLIMLGVASLMPSSEEDYACNMANSFARSLNPMLRHEGPPPY